MRINEPWEVISRRKYRTEAGRFSEERPLTKEERRDIAVAYLAEYGTRLGAWEIRIIPDPEGMSLKATMVSDDKILREVLLRCSGDVVLGIGHPLPDPEELGPEEVV